MRTKNNSKKRIPAVSRAVGNNFHKWLVSAFGTTAVAGKMLNVSSQTFYDYFHGFTLPGSKMLLKCIPFGLDINWLYGANPPQIGERKHIYYNPVDSNYIINEFKKKLEILINNIKVNTPEYHKESFSALATEEMLELFFGIFDVIRRDYKLTPKKRYQLLKELFILTDLPIGYFETNIDRLLSFI